MCDGYLGYYENGYNYNDSLKARFTGWLKKLIIRTRIRYIQKIKYKTVECSIDIVPDRMISYEDTYFVADEKRNDEMDFEEKRIAKAFSELPLMKREVLKLLFYDEFKPQEISELLGCSLQHVYNQKSLALKILREILSGGK